MKRYRYFKISVLILSLCCIAAASFAQHIRFELRVDKNVVPLGSSIQLDLAFYGTQNISAPELPEIEGFETRYLGPSTRMSIVNGKASTSISHIYKLIATRTGIFEIGPFHQGYRGEVYTSNSVKVEVFKGPAPPTTKKFKQHSERTNVRDRVFLIMETGKKNAYINEDIPVSIKLYIDNVAVKGVQYPEFQHKGFSANEFGKPKQTPQALKGVMYDVLEFETTVYGVRPGEFTLGPATMEGSISVPQTHRRRSPFGDPLDDSFLGSFFGNVETYPISLESEMAQVTVLGLPEEGKPEGFKGTVGSFDMNVLLKPRKVKAGDPITLTMTVSGEGNMNTVYAPQLGNEANFKVYKPKVIKQTKNLKIFEQVLIPKKEGIKEVPSVSFDYFDPVRKKYSTTEKGPFPIDVEKPESEEQLRIIEMPEHAQMPVSEEVLGRDIIYIKDLPGAIKRKGVYLYRNKIFLTAQVLPIAFLIAIFFSRRKRTKLRNNPRYARRIRASKDAREGMLKVRAFLDKGDMQKFYDEVFKTMKEYIGNKFHMPSGGITADIADEALRSRGTGEEALRKAKEIFNECDMARYAPSELDRKAMAKTFDKINEVIKYVERMRI